LPFFIKKLDQSDEFLCLVFHFQNFKILEDALHTECSHIIGGYPIGIGAPEPDYFYSILRPVLF